VSDSLSVDLPGPLREGHILTAVLTGREVVASDHQRMAVPPVLASLVGHHQHPFRMLSGARETQLVGLQQTLNVQLAGDGKLTDLTLRRAEDVQGTVVRAEDEPPGSLRNVVVFDVHVAWIVVHQLQEHANGLSSVRPVPWDLINDDDLLPQVAVEEPGLGSSN